MARLGDVLGHHPGCPGSLCQGRGPSRATTSLLPFVPAVPTVPPGNVQTEATNSTTIRFTWNPPSPQFIKGINQGYKVRGDSSQNPGSLRWGPPGPPLVKRLNVLAGNPGRLNRFQPDYSNNIYPDLTLAWARSLRN